MSENLNLSVTTTINGLTLEAEITEVVDANLPEDANGVAILNACVSFVENGKPVCYSDGVPVDILSQPVLDAFVLDDGTALPRPCPNRKGSIEVTGADVDYLLEQDSRRETVQRLIDRVADGDKARFVRICDALGTAAACAEYPADEFKMLFED